MHAAVRAERAQVFDAVGLLADGEIALERLRGNAPEPRRWQDRLVDWAMGRSRVRHCQASALDLLTAALQAMELDPGMQQPTLAAWEDQHRAFLIEYDELGSAVARLFPNFRRFGAMMWRDRATLQAGVLALAAERFRLEQGRWPQTVAELAPAYIAAAPVDPYGGNTFRLRRLPDGIVIYSIGPDGVDNRGEIIRSQRGRWEGDIGVQLWDPQNRGRLPLPPAGEPGK
jgi:hypothetical protein